MNEEEMKKAQLLLERWVDSHAAPDVKIMYVGQQTFTPREIMNCFKEQIEPVASVLNNVDTVTFMQTLDR